MTVKRILLSVLTVIALFLVTGEIVNSFTQPQIQSRLELYQTNLVLDAAQWRSTWEGVDTASAQKALLGEKPVDNALNQYQESRESAQKSLETKKGQLQALEQQGVAVPAVPKPPAPDMPVKETASTSEQEKLQITINELETFTDELDLKIGILQAQQNQVSQAQTTWKNLIAREAQNPNRQSVVNTAQILQGLWNDPPTALAEAEPVIQQNLEGWFEYRALTRLYQVENQETALASLQANEQVAAENAVVKLALVGGLPALGFFTGTLLIVFLLLQRLLKGKDALLAQNANTGWETPWNGETIWQVLVVGFFFVGQILVPLSLIFTNQLLNLEPAGFDVRAKALYILVSYILLAGGGLAVIYFSVKPFFPLPEEWFRVKLWENWILWGVGGYLVALPLVILVSLINQKIWQGQGGSNPIISIALEGNDNVALAIFFLTASVGAPIFEELMFRGFLLPSLTKYMPVWGAIAASALLFAVAHLNVSEILPLATLGAVLGFIYTRSRNLLAPMLLHCLWNTGTLMSLILLRGSV
jgi:membrane protease YdiL (CAAX protease family)